MIQIDARSPFDDALGAILRPGQDIVVAQAYGFPSAAVAALANHLDRLQGSRIFFGMVLGEVPELPGVHIETLFPSGPFGTDQAMRDRGVGYCRQSLFEVADAFRSGARNVDVALSIATPERDGRHSLGLGADYIHPAIERAPAVLLETVEDLPWPGHGAEIAVDGRIRAVASRRSAPVAQGAGGGGDGLADRLLDWIPHGSTLEFGMGKWSEPLFGRLAVERKGLRLHSGSLGDWLVPLLESGAVDRSAPLIATAIGGSRAFYDALPSLGVDLVPAYVTHDPARLRRLPCFRAINSVLQVDLLGRANSEHAGGGRRGGLGGLPDFARGAAENPAGLSIIALNAAAGPESRVVARLPDDYVSLDENCIDIIVTDRGSADLRGLAGADRVLAMLEIAAPDHRDRLHSEGLEAGLI